MKKLIGVLLSIIILASSVTAFGAENKFGFDVSHNNSSVNYAQQIENGNSFVMIRLGNYTYLDKEFWSNVQKACEAGLDFGVYMYSAAFDVEEAKLEADFTIKTLAEMPEEYKKHFTLPVAYDMEATGLKDFNKAQLTNQVIAYSEKIIKAGYVPMVYANVDWFTNRLDIKKFSEKGYKIWLSHWSSNPDFGSKKQVGETGIYADMWQYQGGESHPTGLDQNVAYNIDELKHIYRLTSTVKPTCSKDGSKNYTCPACGKTKSTKLKATGNHIYDDGKVTKKPTSSAKGELTYSCKTCGKKKVSKISKLSKASISKLTAKSKGFTISWKKTSNTTGYQVQYATDSKFKKNVKKVTVKKSKTTSVKVSKLKSKKKYYARIRTYRTINGQKYYSSWSSAKSITTKK